MDKVQLRWESLTDALLIQLDAGIDAMRINPEIGYEYQVFKSKHVAMVAPAEDTKQLFRRWCLRAEKYFHIVRGEVVSPHLDGCQFDADVKTDIIIFGFATLSLGMDEIHVNGEDDLFITRLDEEFYITTCWYMDESDWEKWARYTTKNYNNPISTL